MAKTSGVLNNYAAHNLMVLMAPQNPRYYYGQSLYIQYVLVTPKFVSVQSIMCFCFITYRPRIYVVALSVTRR